METEFCKDCSLLKFCKWQDGVSNSLSTFEKSKSEIEAQNPSLFNRTEKEEQIRSAYARHTERKAKLIKEIDPDCPNLKRV